MQSRWKGTKCQNFLNHLYHDNRGWVPEGSLINGSPLRYWLLWYDYRNYERFTKNIREPQLLKAEPPWMAPDKPCNKGGK